MNTTLQASNEFYEQSFKSLQLEGDVLEGKTFEACTFENCHLVETDFKNCQFVECEFVHCNLSNAKIRNCTFNEVVFDNCKLIGINWTEIKWPLVQLNSPFKFYNANLDDCSFFQLEISELTLQACSAKRVDFRESNLSHSLLIETNFEGALFQATNLESSDFSEAVNYVIDPTQNKIRKAKFTLPDAMNLLLPFEIEVPELA